MADYVWLYTYFLDSRTQGRISVCPFVWENRSVCLGGRGEGAQGPGGEGPGPGTDVCSFVCSFGRTEILLCVL